jgi:hypothetical protein
MSNEDRVLAAVRARVFLHLWRSQITTLASLFPDLYSTRCSFISPESFNIFNRHCDTLILLVLAYARYYPDQPFCIWMFGTHFVDHFFGISRKLPANYAYAELLKIVQHVVLRQRLLMSGRFNEKREKLSRVGYIIEYSSLSLSSHEQRSLLVTLTNVHLDTLVELGFREATAICKELLHIPTIRPTIQSPLALIPLGASSQHIRPKFAGKKSAIIENSQCNSKPHGADDIDSDSSADTDGGSNNDSDNDDASPLSNSVTREAISRAATQSTMRYAALCEDYEHIIADIPSSELKSPAERTTSQILADGNCAVVLESIIEPVSVVARSALFDDSGKLSISHILNARKSHQSETKVHSERVITIDSKFALHRVIKEESASKSKLSITREYSHRLAVMQKLDVDFKNPAKAREERWKVVIGALPKDAMKGVLLELPGAWCADW